MKLVKNYKEAATILKNNYGMHQDVISCKKAAILQFIKNHNLYICDYGCLEVAVLDGPSDTEKEVYSYDLVDYLRSSVVTSTMGTKKQLEFDQLGGVVYIEQSVKMATSNKIENLTVVSNHPDKKDDCQYFVEDYYTDENGYQIHSVKAVPFKNKFENLTVQKQK